MTAVKRPPGVGGTATFSLCERYRYRLTRQWHAGEPRLCAWWMLNPSKAGAADNDLTIAKVCGFSQRWGLGGVVVVNMFALVSTNPKVMLTDDDPVGPDNDAHLRSVLRDMPAVARIVCAWGNLRTLAGAHRLTFLERRSTFLARVPAFLRANTAS